MKITAKTLTKNHNVSSESDTSLFFRYMWFFIFIVLSLYILFFVISFAVINFVSIEDEKKWFGSIDEVFSWSSLPDVLGDRYDDIPYTLQVIDMDGEENAFASLGGKIYITRALLDTVDSYETLDFIIGHEVAHIENRDVLKGIISSLPVTLMLSLFWGDYGSVLFNGIVWNTHSKLMESKADRDAIEYVYIKNNHVWCALDFFEDKNTIGDNVLEIFSTHPVTKFRIERIEKYIDIRGYEKNECTPLELQ